MSISETEALEHRLTRPSAPYALSEGACGMVYSYGPKNLQDLFDKANGRGDKPFLVTTKGALVYGDVLNRAKRVAANLGENYNIVPGTRVGLLVKDRVNWVVAFLGILATGGVPVLLPSRGYPWIKKTLLQTRCDILLTDETEFTAKRATQQIVPLSEIEHGDKQWIKRPIQSNDCEAVVCFTSGSTGGPKAVSLSHRSIVSGLMNMMLSSSLASSGTKRAPGGGALCPLILSPLNYIGGFSQVLLCVMLGGKCAILQDWTTEIVAEFAHENEVSSIGGLSTHQAIELLEDPESAVKLRSVRSWYIFGIRTNTRLIKLLFERLSDIAVSTGYGLTETSGTICSVSWRSGDEEPKTLGRVVPTADVRLVDEMGLPVGDGQCGQIWLRGSMVMSGYLDQAGEPIALADGWFNTGDYGYLTETRQLALVNRASEILSIGSKTIAISEIEELLEGMLESGEVSVLPLGQERAPFAVALSGQVDNLVKASIQRELAERYGLESYPPVVALPPFARTDSGKIDKQSLKVSVLEHLNSGNVEAVQ